jgi:hypothetical protein
MLWGKRDSKDIVVLVNELPLDKTGKVSELF